MATRLVGCRGAGRQAPLPGCLTGRLLRGQQSPCQACLKAEKLGIQIAKQARRQAGRRSSVLACRMRNRQHCQQKRGLVARKVRRFASRKGSELLGLSASVRPGEMVRRLADACLQMNRRVPFVGCAALRGSEAMAGVPSSGPVGRLSRDPRCEPAGRDARPPVSPPPAHDLMETSFQRMSTQPPLSLTGELAHGDALGSEAVQGHGPVDRDSSR